MADRFSGKHEDDKDKMLPWNIYCLKYGANGEDIVRGLIAKGEVFVKDVDGQIFAGHREMSTTWTSGNVTETDLTKAGSSLISV